MTRLRIDFIPEAEKHTAELRGARNFCPAEAYEQCPTASPMHQPELWNEGV